MSNKENLAKAKSAKNDDFYTPLDVISAELANYKSFFKNKTVLCNCDDPKWSNFWRYLHMNFSNFGLKKLISTHYLYADKTIEDINKSNTEWDYGAYKMEYAGDNDADTECGIVTPLYGDGDFRSDECIKILADEADIIVTNPPFSLFREYVATLMTYKKKFVIIGNLNAVSYKEIFPLIQDNKMWCGHNGTGKRTYMVPSNYAGAELGEDGKYYKSLGNTMWFTNLPIKKRSEELIPTLQRSYEQNKDMYPKYDNCDAIEVSKL